MEKIGGAKYKVTYNNKDVSSDISQNLLSINYKDATGEEADELTIKVENVDAFWENEWYPEKGAKISCDIGYEAMMNCGTFEVDEIEISSMPDEVSIRAISAPIKGKLRTKKNYGHENTSLKQIVQKVADANGLTLQGEIDDIKFDRLSQFMETDLAFLNRLAGQFGYYFSIRGTLLTFTRMFDLMNGSSVAALDRLECINYTVKDKSHKVFRKAHIAYTSSKKNAPHEYTVPLVTQYNADGMAYQTLAPISVYVDKIKNKAKHDAYVKKYPNAPAGYEEYYEEMSLADYFKKLNEDNMQASQDGRPTDDPSLGFNEPAGDDDYESNERVENDGQAEAIGTAALLNNNTNQQELTFTCTGNPLIVAGNNIQVTGIGKLSGKYHLVGTEHHIDRASGWITTGNGKRVGFIEIKKAARKKAKKKSAYQISVTK